jgi:hypothetical protein
MADVKFDNAEQLSQEAKKFFGNVKYQTGFEYQQAMETSEMDEDHLKRTPKS